MNEISIDLYRFEVTAGDKVFFPDDGITKGELVDYYADIASAMFPHVQGRVVMMQRMPDGIKGECFYQKEAPDYFPNWIKRVSIEKEGGERLDEVVIDNQATIAYLAEEACITPHVWLSRADRLTYPDKMVFDLDPPHGGDFTHVRTAAVALRGLLEEELGLTAFVMTTGSRGLHVAVPLDRGTDFNDVRQLAEDAASVLARRFPDELTTEQRKENRGSRLFLDTLRNSYAQTSVPPYAVRAFAGAPVAAPLDWDELSDINLNLRQFNLRGIRARLEQKGDPWALFWDQICALDEAQERLDALFSEIAAEPG